MNQISSSITQIDPSSISSTGFELEDQSIIPNSIIKGEFDPLNNIIELFIYDSNKNIIESNYNFLNYSILNTTNISVSNSLDVIQLDPTNDLINFGYNSGVYNLMYNFINYELTSSPINKFYLKDISPDRTEIRISSNFVSKEELGSSFNSLKEKISNNTYFDEFYVCFNENKYFICINLLLDNDDVLIKLYQPLPLEFNIKNELYVTTKVAESQGYEVRFFNDLSLSSRRNFIGGPNINISIKDKINNPTEYKSYQDLYSSNSSGSKNQLSNILNKNGIYLYPSYSYSSFDEFIHFSSAKKRLENFSYKVSLLESYQNDITNISNITGSTSSSIQISSSLNTLNNNISDIIKNFDDYEYYLYYETGSSAYPKSNSTPPYSLYSTASVNYLTWLGSDDPNNQYYGGIILSASNYDNTNPDYLYYSIPEFIRSNSDNEKYIDFINMIGQHFDELWLYIKNINQISNNTNELYNGIPLQLVNDAIKSFGFEEISNNYNNYDNYSGLIGISSTGEFLPPTGSELITDYIAINSGNISSSWNPDYEFLNAFPYAIDDISKEIYKRLFHNMSYLVKKKGTLAGLRQLINIWGIPDTILRINEFGGKNKDNTNDYDLWYNRYSYALNTRGNALVKIPWKSLLRNAINDQVTVPDSIQFQFKTTGFPSSSAGVRYTQSLLLKKSNSTPDQYFDFGIYLYYTGSYSSGSYSGSIQDPYRDYGTIKFFISASTEHGGTKESDPIYLPFFNKDWWGVMLQRSNHVSASNNSEDTTYTLYVKNNIYNGYDGNKIGYQGSASINTSSTSSMYGSASYGTGSYGTLSSINRAWNSIQTSSLSSIYNNIDALYLGGYISGSIIGTFVLSPSNTLFSGSFREFRYYSQPISESLFDDYVMNPESIEGLTNTGSNSSFDIVNFRASLGNELESKFETTTTLKHSQSFTSIHPAIINNELMTGSMVMRYFAGSPPSQMIRETSSLYEIVYHSSSFTGAYSEPVIQTYYADQVISGIRNRVNNKIQVVESSSYGYVLSSNTSIQQNYQIDDNYTEDTNLLEVSFSPQEQINDDITQALSHDAIQNILGDVREISSSGEYYESLRNLSKDYFKKYTENNIYDFIRLIKFFDNSLFKAIKNYVPARTSLTTGIVIKQHLLERNKVPSPTLTYTQPYYTSSISIGSASAGTGGSLNQFNYSGSASFGFIDNSQSWSNSFDSEAGLVTIIEDTQKEFYNGEYSGSRITATTQSLNPDNPFLNSLFEETSGNIYYSGSLIDNVYNGIDNIYWSASTSHVDEQQIRSQSISQSYEGIYSVEFSASSYPMFIAFSSSLYKNPPIYPSGYLNMYVYLSTYPTSSQFFISGFANDSIVGSSININPYINTSSLNVWQHCSIPLTNLIVPATPIEQIIILSYNTSTTSSQIFFDNITVDFTNIFLPSSSYNNYNPTLNNVSNNRENFILQDVDYSYDFKKPVNLSLLISGSASRAQTPDSNYTTTRIIKPRYEGSRLSGLKYNEYNPSGTVQPDSTMIIGLLNRGNVSNYFMNGDTGSWGGDITYGKDPVIESRPTYFAHFKNSYENYNIWDTYTFNLDQLIQIPDQDITSNSNFSPKIIPLSPDTKYVLDVSSTFQKNDLLNIIYNSDIYNGIDYTNFKIKKPKIYQGAINYQTLYTNQKDRTYNSYSQSFSRYETIYTGSYTAGVVQMATSSEGSFLILSGSLTNTIYFFKGEQIPFGPGLCSISGPRLAVYNMYNQYLYSRQTDTSAAISPYIRLWVDDQLDPTDIRNYFVYNSSASLTPSYEEPSIPFLILPGDEIRVKYSASSNNNVSEYEQIFTVLGYPENPQGNNFPHDSGSANNHYTVQSNGIGYNIGSKSLSPQYETMLVTPNPNDLDVPIPNGLIYTFTIRRKIESSNKLIINTSPPSGSQGIRTLSGGGFIFPESLSETQRDNLYHIINSLKEKNSFRNDDNNVQ